MRMVVAATLLVTMLPKGSNAFSMEQTVAYGPDPEQLLTICTPPTAHAPSPAVLMIHGGGWQGGSRLGATGRCVQYAEQGVVAIAVDYRLTTGSPATRWPAQFNDVQLALRWVRSHAGDYGIDPAHICAEGESAGGQLALLLGVVPGIEAGDSQATLALTSPRADCVIAISGPTNFITYSQPYPRLVSRLIGPLDDDGTRAMETDASPLLRLHSGMPPTLLIHGHSDSAVPFDQAVTMYDALVRVGTPAWLIDYQGDHVLRGMSPLQKQATWRLVVKFAKERALKVPPGRLTIDEAMDELK